MIGSKIDFIFKEWRDYGNGKVMYITEAGNGVFRFHIDNDIITIDNTELKDENESQRFIRKLIEKYFG